MLRELSKSAELALLLLNILNLSLLRQAFKVANGESYAIALRAKAISVIEIVIIIE